MTSDNTTNLSADVIVVGAGAAGATAAAVMARHNVRVILLDQRATCPPCFKAEKIEPHQADLFRKFGLMDNLLPLTGRVRTILDAKDGRVFKEIPIEQYGIFYHDLVNAIRSSTPAVQQIIGRVSSLSLGPSVQSVTMADGTTLTARLVVDACGTSTSLVNGLGLERETINKEQSVAFGFTLGRADGSDFDFDSVTYYPEIAANSVAYLTLFRIREAMRANLFVFWQPRDERIRRLQQSMDTALPTLFPKLDHVIGKYKVVSKVETVLVDLYRTVSPARAGLVLIGDAFQSVCPTTATGLSKLLSDVDVLCYECLPRWLATPGMEQAKMQEFYDNPSKQDVDRRSLGGGLYQRAMAVDTSVAWTARRLRRGWRLKVAEWKYPGRAHAATAQ